MNTLKGLNLASLLTKKVCFCSKEMMYPLNRRKETKGKINTDIDDSGFLPSNCGGLEPLDNIENLYMKNKRDVEKTCLRVLAVTT